MPWEGLLKGLWDVKREAACPALKQLLVLAVDCCESSLILVAHPGGLCQGQDPEIPKVQPCIRMSVLKTQIWLFRNAKLSVFVVSIQRVGFFYGTIKISSLPSILNLALQKPGKKSLWMYQWLRDNPDQLLDTLMPFPTARRCAGVHLRALPLLNHQDQRAAPVCRLGFSFADRAAGKLMSWVRFSEELCSPLVTAVGLIFPPKS